MAFRSGDALGQAPVAGTVTSVSGTVQIARGAATTLVTKGIPVQVGDRIITGDDGHIAVLLIDQSTLELSDSTNMVVDQHAGTTTHVNLFGGKLRSLVNRTVGANSPDFEVHTPNAVAAARGTLFDTAFFSGPNSRGVHEFTDVSVYQGVVNLANINNLAGGIEIPAGFESTVAGILVRENLCLSSPKSVGTLQILKGKGVSGIQITAVDRNTGKTVGQDTTDNDGNFSMCVPVGGYILKLDPLATSFKADSAVANAGPDGLQALWHVARGTDTSGGRVIAVAGALARIGNGCAGAAVGAGVVSVAVGAAGFGAAIAWIAGSTAVVAGGIGVGVGFGTGALGGSGGTTSVASPSQ